MSELPIKKKGGRPRHTPEQKAESMRKRKAYQKAYREARKKRIELEHKKPSPVVQAKNRQEGRKLAEKRSTAHLTEAPEIILVDSRLEEKGQKTEPASEQAAPRGTTHGADRRTVCEKCGRELPTDQFSMLKAAVRDSETGKLLSPLVKDVACMACRAKENADDLRAKNLDRASSRLSRQLIRDEARKKARKRKEARAAGFDQRKATVDSKVIAEHAGRELARRELGRRRLLYFTQRFEGQKVDEHTGELVEVERAKGKGYVADWVHKDVCARLERFLTAVRAGQQPRLMLFMPPRHGKSTIASRMFPAWGLGQDPTLEIIAASYGSSLPVQFSGNVRGILRDPEYRAIFPRTMLDPERENVLGWATSEGGQYIPAGVGSGITGKGADLLIIDDPFKGAEDAENPTQREKVLDWYLAEAYLRLSPRAGVLIILTRWHDADLAGSLLESQKEQEQESEEIYLSELEEIEKIGLSRNDTIQALVLAQEEHEERLRDVEQWEVVSYAAIAETDEYRRPDGTIVQKELPDTELLRRKGEALHPSRFPLGRLRKIRKSLLARGRQRFWHALYQQKPVPDEGVHFSKNMIRFEKHPSQYQRSSWLRLTAWDLAAGQDAQHDYTVGVSGAMDFDGTIHVYGLVRGRFDGANGVATEVLDEYERNRPQMAGVEKGALEKFLMPNVKTQLATRNKERGYKGRLTPVFAEGEYSLSPIQDPVLRAQPLQGLLQQGKMVFSENLEYQEEMSGELVRFPGGVHDDIVTALSWLARLAIKFNAPREPTLKQRKRSWKDKLARFTKGRGLGHMAA